MKWTKEQQNVIDFRNRDILVSAAAGSGKTAVLVARIIQRILDPQNPVDIDRLLVVTFTKAAAAEMREDGCKNVQFKSHIQIGSRFIKNQNLCVLADRPCQHKSLPLPITDSPEILLLHFPGMYQCNRFIYFFPVLVRKDSKSPGVWIAPGCHHIPAA